MVATSPDPLGGPVHILPAHCDQLALPQTRHSRGQVVRSVERPVVSFNCSGYKWARRFAVAPARRWEFQ
jgi:hypothetical protein